MKTIKLFNFDLARKVLSVLIFSAVFFCSANAQDYRTSLGAKFGYYGANVALDLKTFISSQSAIELLAFDNFYTGFKYYDVGSLYEFHQKTPDFERLSWCYGGGAFMGFWNYDTQTYKTSGNGLRIAGIIGAEYRVPKIPLALNLSWIPNYALNTEGFFFKKGLTADGFSVAARITFF